MKISKKCLILTKIINLRKRKIDRLKYERNIYNIELVIKNFFNR